MTRNYEALERQHAREEARLRHSPPASKAGSKQANSRSMAAQCWAHILKALAASESAEDRKLADHVVRLVKDMPAVPERLAQGNASTSFSANRLFLPEQEP